MAKKHKQITLNVFFFGGERILWIGCKGYFNFVVYFISFLHRSVNSIK